MKLNINRYIAVLLMLPPLLTACEKDYQVYNTNLQAVYFDLQKFTNNVDSLFYSFALKPGVEKDTINVPVLISGFTFPQERVVNVVSDLEKTTAKADVDYTILPCIIPADRMDGVLRVCINKTDNSKEHPVVVALKITGSPDFVPGPLTKRNFRIILINKLVKPADWRAEFGIYSVVKHQFIIDETGMGTGFSQLGLGSKFIYLMRTLHNALYKYNNEHPGAPLLDENGVQVAFT